jgi:hypothetical protein
LFPDQQAASKLSSKSSKAREMLASAEEGQNMANAWRKTRFGIISDPSFRMASPGHENQLPSTR